MLDRGVRDIILQKGLEWPFSAVKGLLRDADIAFLNLESSVTDRGGRMPGKGIWFRMPPSWLQALVDAGIDIVSVANNHVMDYDEEALLDTLNHLDHSGISRVGAGADISAARLGRILTVNGLRVGFLAYSDFWDIFWSSSYRKTSGASEGKPGIAPSLSSFMSEDIRRLKRHADFVVVSVHWGQEYMTEPDYAQKARGRAAIDAGADVVLGHHPHVLQPVESYNGGLIFYSLGNFVFDQKKPKTTESMIALITLRKNTRPAAELVPLRISQARPAPMEPEDAEGLLSRLRSGCAALGTHAYASEGRLLVRAGTTALFPAFRFIPSKFPFPGTAL